MGKREIPTNTKNLQTAEMSLGNKNQPKTTHRAKRLVLVMVLTPCPSKPPPIIRRETRAVSILMNMNCERPPMEYSLEIQSLVILLFNGLGDQLLLLLSETNPLTIGTDPVTIETAPITADTHRIRIQTDPIRNDPDRRRIGTVRIRGETHRITSEAGRKRSDAVRVTAKKSKKATNMHRK